MNDLTIIMLTPNLVPSSWAKYHKEKLLEAADGAPIITISAKPLDWGLNLIQNEYGLANLFKQLLIGAKAAKTEWIARADDDTLYPKDHFAFRPKEPGFYYNFNRWHLLTWTDPYFRDPYYFYKPRPGGGLMIATRKLVIDALEARMAADPGFKSIYSFKELADSKEMRNYDRFEYKQFYTVMPIVSFYHQKSIDDLNRRRKKKAWPVRAFDLPLWGRAEDLRKKFR